MKRQHGQALVEFAFMMPLMFLMVFGLIYGAVIFLDYLNFSNDARAVARRIAVTTNETDRAELIDDYNKAANSKFARFYNVTRQVGYSYAKKTITTDEGTTEEVDDMTKPIDVVVVVKFERDNKDLPLILYKTGFPPEEFAIRYTMKLEKLDYSS